MKVIQLGTYKEIQACVKFDYKGYEISLSTDNGRPWLAVFDGDSNSPVFLGETYDMLTDLDAAKAFIDDATIHANS